MAEASYKRKLTAVFSADVVGYSRLMGDDEAATVRTLEIYKGVMSELIRQHRGRVVDSPGDNMLAEFASVVDAVQCAVAVQNELKARNADLPENRRMQIRIGVNLGDVIEEESRIYGDGVNIAARLEALADPGGVCISKTSFDHIETKLPLGYEYLGEQTVKNIARPVGAYKVLMEPRVTVKAEAEKGVRGKPFVLGLLGAVVLIGAVALWQFVISPKPAPMEKADPKKMAYPLPDKPSIAVLPFVNMSADPEQEFFSDGITEDIITALSKLPRLFVIARNSTFTYKGKPVKVQQVSEELGVQYVLEGSVRKAGDKVRVTAQLIDALTGRHLWADRYDRKLEEIFVLQDEITMHIITELRVKLAGGEQARLDLPCTMNLQAYLKYLEATHHFFRRTAEDNLVARRLAEEAIALDPGYACAFSLLGATHLVDVWLGSTKSPGESIAKARENIDKAIGLNPSLAGPRAMLGLIYRTIGQLDRALEEAEKALALDPNSRMALGEMGAALRFAGRSEESIPYIEQAIRTDPLSTWYDGSLGLSYLFAGRFDDAVRVCKRAAERDPKDIFARLCLAATCSAVGREQEAQAAAAEILRINPGFSLERFSKTMILKKQADKELLLGGLRKAGLPD